MSLVSVWKSYQTLTFTLHKSGFMKIVLLAIILLLSFTTYAQDSLLKVITTHVCQCMEKQDMKINQIFNECIDEFALSNPEVIEKLIKERSLGNSQEDMYSVGRKFGEILSIELMYNCPAYYRAFDSLRNVGLNQFNKDTVQLEIALLNNIDSTKRDNTFYTKRGVLYVKAHEFDLALKDFETAVRLNQATGETLYFKAWMHEKKKEYDKALALYDTMISQSGIAAFKIAAAYVKKKRELEQK